MGTVFLNFPNGRFAENKKIEIKIIIKAKIIRDMFGMFKLK